MGEVFIVSATRTAIGDFGGSLKEVSATSLGIGIMDSCTSRIEIEKKVVDQIIMGNVFEFLNGNVARIAAVKSGFPIEIPAYSIHATCGSGMQAIISGAQAIHDGDAGVVLAGGIESMSTAPYVLTTTRWGQRLQHGELVDTIWRGMQEYPIGAGMGMTAENLGVEIRNLKGRAG